jgi:exodeoxyribonuclease VII large subunit
VHCADAHAALAAAAARLERQGRRAILDRARTLTRLSRAPAEHVARHRVRLHQQLRELRAAARRGVADRERSTRSRASALRRKGSAADVARHRGAQRAGSAAAALNRATAASLERRRRDLDRIGAALAAHDPQRTLERGYALVEDRAGGAVTSAAAARAQPALTLRLHDGRVAVTPDPSAPPVP